MPSGYPSECDLRATADGLIVRANVAATVPLIHLAVDVVQHEAHVVVHIPVQAERDVLLPTAEDILVVEVDNAVARGHNPCTPVDRPPAEGTTWRKAPITAGVCAVAYLLPGGDITAVG